MRELFRLMTHYLRYHTLGVDWATSLLAFIAVALFPVPILFYIYGSRIRKLSRYSPSA